MFERLDFDIILFSGLLHKLINYTSLFPLYTMFSSPYSLNLFQTNLSNIPRIYQKFEHN